MSLVAYWCKFILGWIFSCRVGWQQGLHQMMTRTVYAEALNAKVDELSCKSSLDRSRGQDSLFSQLSRMAEKAIGAFGTSAGLDV